MLFPTDLADPEAIAWHLAEPRRNATSLTGTAHRRSSYLALPEGWTTTPDAEWPDHFMWKKFFRQPGFRGATHSELTAVQLPTSSGREDVPQVERLRELEDWDRRLREPDSHERMQRLVARAAERQLAVEHRLAHDAVLREAALAERLATVAGERGQVSASLGSVTAREARPPPRPCHGNRPLRGRIS